MKKIITLFITLIFYLNLAAYADSYVLPSDPKCRYLNTDQDAQECLSKEDYAFYIKRKKEAEDKRKNVPRKKSPFQIMREEREEHMKYKVEPLGKPKTIQIKN